jgi:POT family proton-dependent oligopeptide transporter
LIVFAFIPSFWALYDQNGSEWVLQAQYLDLNCFGRTWLPEQIQAINPILILIFIPVFSLGVYPALEKIGIRVTPLRKIGAGLVLTAVSFVIIAMLQTKIDAGLKPNVIWQFLAYFILTAAEILISITGLEYAYTRAPKTMKSVIMSFWLLTVSLGNILVSLINNSKASGGFFAQYSGAGYYWLFLGIITVVFIIFLVISIIMKESGPIVAAPIPLDPNLVEN